MDISILHKAARTQGEEEHRYVEVRDGSDGLIEARHSVRRDDDGKDLYKVTSYYGYEADAYIEERGAGTRFDDEGQVLEKFKNIIAPVDDGVYRRTYTDYAKEQNLVYGSPDQPNYAERHITDKLDYSETTIRAQSVTEYYELQSQSPFTDPVPELGVSMQSISVQGENDYRATETDWHTGQTEEIHEISSLEQLRDYTYLGQTGVYVGWDWCWEYKTALDPKTDEVLSNTAKYSVTEYSYSSDEGWFKTNVYVTPREGGESDLEKFKQSYQEGTLNLGDYSLESHKSVYHKAEGSSEGSWQYVQSVQSEVEAIVLGNTSVTVGDDILTQEERKQELLELEETLREAAPTDDMGSCFDEAVHQVNNGDELLAEVEVGLETNSVPESNTTEQPEHDCFEEMSGETIVSGEEAP